MVKGVGRREFLKSSAALASAAAASGFMCVEFAQAGSGPGTGRRQIVSAGSRRSDSQHLPAAHDLQRHDRNTRAAVKGLHQRAAHAMGLSYLLHSARGDETRGFMLDYGYTPEALLNNFELVGADATKSTRSSSATAISTITAA